MCIKAARKTLMKLIQDHKERYEDKRNEITELRKVYQVKSVNSAFV